MFDAVIFSGKDPEAAARTMAFLVEGVVEGMLRRVIVVSGERGADLERLADASGCRLEQGIGPERVPAILASHIETPHVLVFAAGALLPPGWPVLLMREFQRRGQPAADTGLAFRPERWSEKLVLTAKIALRGCVPLAHGVLLPKEWVTDAGYRGGAVTKRGPVRLTDMRVGRIG